MKYPLRCVKLIDADDEVLEGFKVLERYIKEELNCMEIELENNEDEFIQYNAVPENKPCGQAFGKKFNAQFKEALKKLTNDEIKEFLSSGEIMIGDCKVEEGMLKIHKQFRDQVINDHNWG